MNKKYTIIFAALIAFAVLGIAFAYRDYMDESVVMTISPAGTATSTTAKLISFSMTPSSGSATSSSVLNSSGFDYAIVSNAVMCQSVGTSLTAYSGAGLANWIYRAATTSSIITQNLASVNANYIVNDVVSTSTTDSYIASTTEGVIFGTSRIWPNNTYLTWQPNATNTASCTLGVYVMSL